MDMVRPWRGLGGAIAVIAALLSGSAGLAQQRAAPEKLDEESSCVAADCHASLAQGASVHSPAAEESCDVCHEQDDETLHEFTYSDTGEELCYACHKSMTKKKFVHAPLKDKKRPCLSCHNPHSSAGKHLVKAKTTSTQCLACHSEVAKGPRMHASPAVGGCTGCHEPHSSDSAGYLRAAAPKLCYGCHDDIQDDVGQAKVVHGPVGVGCVSCHDPHQSRAGLGLNKAGAAGCVACHEHFADRLKAMSKRHPRLREKRDCLRCHAPHAGEKRFLLTGTSQELCLVCHDKQITSSSGRLVTGRGEELSKGAHLHGPLESQNCAGCHEPHGNDRSAFLRDAYPKGFYSPYKPHTYDLCFRCHEASLAAQRHTTGATRFRNGSVNLHYLHVNKADKGRSCRACHAAHASQNPHMLLDAAPFGAWKIPIGFVEEKNGGTCVSGCHLPQTYSRALPPADGAAASAPATRPAKPSGASTSRRGKAVGDAR